MANFVLWCAVVCALAVRYSDSQEFSIYEIPLIINADGYVSETHHVTTEDGYILEMHRIPYRRGQSESSVRRPAVFLMHGLLSASNSFVLLGHEYSPAYNLADAGFDVWMGNNRGNKLSRFHVTLDPDLNANQFFDYTFEEIGMYDVAAMVDYVLDFTGEEKLHYIGHSQGGTAFLTLASMRPEYNLKFTSVHLLAGVGYQEYFPGEELAQAAQMTDIIYNMAVLLGSIELYPPITTGTQNMGYNTADLCTGDIKQKYLCDLIGVRHFLRDDEEEEEEEVEQPGASLKQVAHFGQNIRDKLFRRWNYGFFQNLQIYGASNPPLYDLSLITSNVTMHYTVSDVLLDERDVLAMVEDIPNAVARKVARETFLHEEFVTAEDAKELVTDYIIQCLSDIEFDQINEDSDSDSVLDSDAVLDSDSNLDSDGASDSIVDTEGNAENENDNESGIGIENETPTTGSATNLTLNFTLVLYSLFILIKAY